MGYGSFDGQKFTLFACFEYDADGDDFVQWQRAFQAASVALFDATDGQMSIRRVTVGNNLHGFAKADAVLAASSGKSSTTKPIMPNAQHAYMYLRDDERAHPGVIVHEFGHYLFDLKNENKNRNGSGHCTNDAPGKSACIMEFSGKGVEIDPLTGNVTVAGTVSEFCCAANHGTKNFQEEKNEESCWDTIVRRWGPEGEWGEFDIVGPALGMEPKKEPPTEEIDPIEWVWASIENRYYLVTADDLSDHLSSLVDSLGEQVSRTLLVPATAPVMAPVRLPYSPQALLELAAAGERAVNQRVVWLTDTLRPPDEVVAMAAQLRRNGAFVHAIGENTDTRIRRLVWQTNGVNRYLHASDDATARVQNSTQRLSTWFEVFEAWSHVDTFAGRLPSDEEPLKEQRPAKVLPPADFGPAVANIWPTHFDFPVLIEEDADSIAFAVCYPAGEALTIVVQSPDGQQFVPGEGGNWFNAPDWQVVTLDRAVAQSWGGRWIIRLHRAQARTEIPFQVLAHSRNPRIRTGLRVEETDDPLVVRILATAHAPRPVAQLEPVMAEVARYTPDGTLLKSEWVPLLQNHHRDGSTVVQRPDGTWRAHVTLQPDQRTRVRVRLVNAGRAVWADPYELPFFDDPHHRLPDEPVPVFTRVLEQWG